MKSSKVGLRTQVRRSNQLSYEVTDVGRWSFVGSNTPVMNESTTIMASLGLSSRCCGLSSVAYIEGQAY